MALMETAIIAGIVGAVGVALVNVIKALYSRNQNKQDQLQHEENLIKLSSSMTNVNQAISELRAEIMPMLNGFSRDLDRMDKKLEDFHREQKSINLVMLRHDIVQVYEQYKNSAAIPTDLYESTMNLYDQYKAAGGNGFISQIVEEMKKWERT